MKILGFFFLLSRETRYHAVVGLFIFCQVIGIMCAVPDLALAGEDQILSADAMICPMEGTIACPPSATSSPERQIRHGMIMDLDLTMILLGRPAVLTIPSTPTRWSWDDASSIVPLSISSSSILRI